MSAWKIALGVAGGILIATLVLWVLAGLMLAAVVSEAPQALTTPNAPARSAREANPAAALEAQLRERRAASEVGRDLTRRCGELQLVASQLPNSEYAAQQADEACERRRRYIETGQMMPPRSRADIRRAE